MERKIGEIFEYNGEWYQCVESDSCRCDYCDFHELGDCDSIACASGERNDNKEVYFKKLEKIGEPFSDECFGLVQRYELKIYGYSTKDKRVCFVDSYNVFIKTKQNKEDIGDNADIRPYNELFSSDTISNTKHLAKENMEEKKLNLKPFDIQKAREGKPVYTRNGRKARIVCFNRIDARPILALVLSTDGKAEDIFDYFVNGKRLANALESDLDLMMLPEKKEGYANIYRS